MHNIGIILKKELKRFFSDKRMVASLILPGLLIFVLYTFMGRIMTTISSVGDDYTYQVYVLGDKQEDGVFNTTLNEALKEVKIDYFYDLDIEAAKVKVQNEEADLVVVYTGDMNSIFTTTTTKPTVELFYNSVRTESASIYSLYLTVLTSINDSLTDKAFNLAPAMDMASEKDKMGTYMAMILPMLLLIFLFTGVMSVVPESIAGEKERGTIATLLVTPLKRRDLALGKILSLSIISLISALSSAIGTILSLPALAGGNIGGFAGLEYTIVDYLLVVFLIISLILLFVGVMSLVSAFAKSVKESNSYSAPLMIVVTLVSVLSMFGSVPENIGIYFIPVYNAAVSLTGIFSYQTNILGLVITIVSNLVYAVACGYMLTRMFNNEKIMFNK